MQRVVAGGLLQIVAGRGAAGHAVEQVLGQHAGRVVKPLIPKNPSEWPQVDYFKSSLDAALLDTLWNKYWVNTLAASPLLATRPLGTGQLTDIGALLS